MSDILGDRQGLGLLGKPGAANTTQPALERLKEPGCMVFKTLSLYNVYRENNELYRVSLLLASCILEQLEYGEADCCA